MSTIDPGDLDLRWRALGRPGGNRLAAERVSDWAGGRVLVAVDSDGTWHLLVQIHDPRTVRPSRQLVGMTVRVRPLRPPGQSEALWLDLASPDPRNRRTFSGLCADLIGELPTSGTADPAAVLAVIERWRRFWTSSRDGLSRDEQLGLFGELWFLLEWLPAITLEAVAAWQGPLQGRHDWVTPETSVEVKTTGTATGPVIHRMHRLEQLDDPLTGTLYLISIRAVGDPNAADSLDSLINRVRAAATAAGDTCFTLLEDRLQVLGITTAEHGRYNDPLRVVRQELYRIDSDFPRLVPNSFPTGLPAGVIDVSYFLDTSACSAWLITGRPDDIDLFGS